MTPVLRWNFIERQQHVSIFPKALHGSLVLRFERVDEHIKRFENYFFFAAHRSKTALSSHEAGLTWASCRAHSLSCAQCNAVLESSERLSRELSRNPEHHRQWSVSRGSNRRPRAFRSSSNFFHDNSLSRKPATTTVSSFVPSTVAPIKTSKHRRFSSESRPSWSLKRILL